MQTRRRRPVHHGQTAAAWTATAIAMVGFIVGTVAFLIGPYWPLVWVAAGIIALSVVVGWGMSLAGYGEYERVSEH